MSLLLSTELIVSTYSRHATPWFSDTIAQVIKEKHKAKHTVEMSGNDNDWSVYYKLKNHLKVAVCQAKVDYTIKQGKWCPKRAT